MAFDKGIRLRGFFVPESELRWSFDPSGGPGGQHANRSSTRATVAFDIAATTAFPKRVRDRLLHALRDRARDGIVTMVVDDTRSQWRNRAIARRRLADVLDQALVPKRVRRRTKPSRATKHRRLTEKRRRSATKRLRKRPEPEE